MLRDRAAKLWLGSLPQVVHDEVVGDVEVANTAPAAAIKNNQAGERIRVWIAKQATRTHVNALAPGVTGLSLNPVAHSFSQPSLKAMVRGTVVPECCANATHVGVQPGAGTSQARAGSEGKTCHRLIAGPEVPCRGQRGNDHIAVIRAE